jgi:hypothetical protein
MGGSFGNTSQKLAKLNGEIAQIMSEIENVDNGSLMYYGNLRMNIPSVANMAAFEDNVQDVFKNPKIINSIKVAITSVFTILKLLVSQSIKKITLVGKSVQYFILNVDNYIDQCVNGISNALTGNTATPTEKSIFRDQAQKLCSILLVWVFIYNWYYIIFFLEDRDNVRWNFSGNLMEKNSPILYAFFGSSVRVVEIMNYMIVGCSALKDYVAKPFIFFFMFFIFTLVVANNYQMTMITDFFNCFDHKIGTSIWVIFVIIIVGCYTLKYLRDHFWFYNNGVFSTIWYFVVSVFYIIFAITINLPLGLIFLTTYFFFYSFMAIFIYEGFNCFTILPSISEDISFINTLNEDTCDNPAGFEYDRIGIYLYNGATTVINYISGYMFEIVVLFILIGGIMNYVKNYNTAYMEKLSYTTVADVGTPVSKAFKQLFTWLILVNIILIVLIILFMIQKYNSIQRLKDIERDNTEVNEDGTRRITIEDDEDDLQYRTKNTREEEAREALRYGKFDTRLDTRLQTRIDAFENKYKSFKNKDGNLYFISTDNTRYTIKQLTGKSMSEIKELLDDSHPGNYFLTIDVLMEQHLETNPTLKAKLAANPLIELHTIMLERNKTLREYKSPTFAVARKGIKYLLGSKDDGTAAGAGLPEPEEDEYEKDADEKIMQGSTVEVKDQATGAWKTGIVTLENGDDTFDVKFSDNTTGANIEEDLIRLKPKTSFLEVSKQLVRKDIPRRRTRSNKLFAHKYYERPIDETMTTEYKP